MRAHDAQVLDGLTANGATYIAAFDRSTDFVRKTQDSHHRAHLLQKLEKVEAELGCVGNRWTVGSDRFKVGKVSWHASCVVLLAVLSCSCFDA
jgi:hypothetical protein